MATTFRGGTADQGTVFRLTPAGVFSTLHSFSVNDDNTPNGLVQGPDGNFYGTTEGFSRTGFPTHGTVFQITTNGDFTTIYTFSGTDGSRPMSALALGRDGYFYGTTAEGGSAGKGTVFRVSSDGALMTLMSFNGDN